MFSNEDAPDGVSETDDLDLGALLGSDGEDNCEDVPDVPDDADGIDEFAESFAASSIKVGDSKYVLLFPNDDAETTAAFLIETRLGV